MHTHHGIYDSVLIQDEERDHDRHLDLKKDKLTMTECIVALSIALTCVSLHAVFLGIVPIICAFVAGNLTDFWTLVQEIRWIVLNKNVSDSFMGLILVPLVEKVAEHLTAVDEAWDNQMNFALAHILGATVQTALFNSPLVVIVGWGLNKAMDLNFETFNIIVLILAIIVVGNFLRDQKSNYLEGSLCILIYIIIGMVPTLGDVYEANSKETAIASWYYPDPANGETNVAKNKSGP